MTLDLSEDLETALLYSVLVDRNQIHAARSIVSPDDFTKTAEKMTGPRGRIFAALCDVVDAGGDHTDVTQLVSRLRECDELVKVGGLRAIARIIDVPRKTENAPTYARKVRELANRRRFEALLRQEMGKVGDHSQSLDSALDRVLNEAAALRSRSNGESLVSIYEAGLKVIDHVSGTTDTAGGVYSGIPAVDECFGIFGNGTLTTIAARTSIGKSGLCLQIANHIALTSGRVLYFSLEMAAIELAFRCLGNASGVCSQQIANRAIEPEDRALLVEALKRYEDAGLMIDDSPYQTHGSIATSAKRMQADGGLDAVFVDHIGLVTLPTGPRRWEAMADVSRSMKRLAKEVDVPVFIACQINRQGDGQGKGRPKDDEGESRPRLSHLADSASIEADSDNVLILHRDRPSDSTTTFGFEKVRNGQTGHRRMRMDLPSTWFVDVDAPTRQQAKPHEEFLGYDTGFNGASNGSF
ncbi:replicative DNA helicase [Rhodopirellula sp. SWK7]|uniref:replicative DNA helicase n=1 Tax=Rhodopirellula sp. SWK7 TaxID=595460 RepID=UPI0002BE7DA3|nr:DnaB-like helicase C-terminal domain-containing protein [Rhodopirellula sp. SWK7]EMI40534.1 replicative DNA helicase [Rhodopirellula sp. SWK7]